MWYSYIMDNKSFYVYSHSKESDGSVFYIGKGTGSRAWDFKKRNEYWKRVAAKYGVIVNILQMFENGVIDDKIAREEILNTYHIDAHRMDKPPKMKRHHKIIFTIALLLALVAMASLMLLQT